MSRNSKSKNGPSRVSKRSDFPMVLGQYSSPLGEVGLTLFLFGLLVWLYVVAIQITHASWMDAAFAHYDVPPFDWRVDDVGVFAFAVAAFGFFVWRLEGRRTHTDL